MPSNYRRLTCWPMKQITSCGVTKRQAPPFVASDGSEGRHHHAETLRRSEYADPRLDLARLQAPCAGQRMGRSDTLAGRTTVPDSRMNLVTVLPKHPQLSECCRLLN